MDVGEVVQRTLEHKLTSVSPPIFQDSMVGRARTRHAVKFATGALMLVAMAIAGVWTFQSADLFRDNSSTNPPVTAPAQASPSPTLDWRRCLTGPWATYCPEAEWARGVAERAGYRVVEDTGSALIIDNGENSFYYKAFEPENPASRQESLSEESYKPVFEVDGTIVYSNGVQLTWDVHGLWAWLESGPEKGPKIQDEDVLAPIVRASIETPYPTNS